VDVNAKAVLEHDAGWAVADMWLTDSRQLRRSASPLHAAYHAA
jgi:hypothetical protein